MTKEKREQLSNRLVLNFGILLVGALVMLYVNSAIKNTFAVTKVAYIVILIIGILGAIAAVTLFVLGKKKNPKLKNYSAVGLGVAICSAMVYASKMITVHKFFPFYTKDFAVIAVYLLMLIYFVVMAIYTAVMIRKPLEKDPVLVAKAKAMQKNKKKRKK